MRDLRQDLEDYHRYMAERSLKVIDLAVNSLPHAIERAINAEAEVERLQKVYAITNESWKKQVEELALLREVADAARAVMPAEQYQYSQSIYNLEQALAELDKAKEGER